MSEAVVNVELHCDDCETTHKVATPRSKVDMVERIWQEKHPSLCPAARTERFDFADTDEADSSSCLLALATCAIALAVIVLYALLAARLG